MTKISEDCVIFEELQTLRFQNIDKENTIAFNV